jgi:hypothetical protein
MHKKHLHKVHTVFPNKEKPAPENLVNTAVYMSILELARHYDVTVNVVRRWMKEKDIIPCTRTLSWRKAMEKSEKKAPVAPRRIPPDDGRVFSRDTELEAPIAADFLRKKFSNVFRADIRLREGQTVTWGQQYACPKGGRRQYFVSGIGVLWIDELIALAEKNGYVRKKPITDSDITEKDTH